MSTASGEQTHVRMTNLERAIGMSRDGPYLAGSSSACDLSQLGEADEGAAHVTYDRLETHALKAMESLFSASGTDLGSKTHHRGRRPHSAPAATFLPERWVAIAEEAEAPGFDAVPEIMYSGLFLNGIEAC